MSLRELSFRVVRTKAAVKYLEVILDHNMRMTRHIERLKKKTLGISKQLNMSMPHSAGPSSSKRRLLVSVIQSVVLYATPVCAKVLRHQKYKRHFDSRGCRTP